MFNVGTVIGGAFGLVRDRLGSVLVWGLLYTLGTFALGYLMMASMAGMLALDENADPAAAFAAMGGLFGRMLLFYFAFMCLYCVLLTAAQRAVLRPQDRGFAYLRLGGDEVRSILLSIILFVIFFVVYLIGAFLIGAIAVGVGVSAVAGGNDPAAGAGLGLAMILGVVALLCVMLFLWVRLSLAYPLTLLRRRIALGEGWRLSSGHFWPLLGAYLVLMVAVIGVSLALSLLLQGDYWASLMDGSAADPLVAQAQMEAQYSFGLQMILSLILSAVIGGMMIALTGGAIASAARALDADHEGMARTFS